MHANGNAIGASSFHQNRNNWHRSHQVTKWRQYNRNTIIPNELLRSPAPAPAPDIPDLVESYLFRNAASKREYMNRETLKQSVEALHNMDVPCNFFGFGGRSPYFTQQHANNLGTNLIKHGDCCSLHIQNSKSMGFKGPVGPVLFKPENPNFMMPPLVSMEISEASTHLTQPNELGVTASFLESSGGSSYFPQLHANDLEILDASTHFTQPNELDVKAYFLQSGGGSSFPQLPTNDLEILEASTHFMQPNEQGVKASFLQSGGGSSFPQLHGNDLDILEAFTHFTQPNELGVKASLPQSGSSFRDQGEHYCHIIGKKTMNPSQLDSIEAVLHPAKRRKKKAGFSVSLVTEEGFSEPKCLKDESFPSKRRSEMQQQIVSTCFEVKEHNMVHLKKNNVKDVVSLPDTFPSDSTKVVLHPPKRRKKEVRFSVSLVNDPIFSQPKCSKDHSFPSKKRSEMHHQIVSTCSEVKERHIVQLENNNMKDVVSLSDTFPSSSIEVVLPPAKRRKKEVGFDVSLVNDECVGQRKCLKDQSFPSEIRSEMQQPIISTCSEVKECNMVLLKKNNMKDFVFLPDTFTRDQLNEHIMSLRKQLIQSTTEEETRTAANACQLFMTLTPINCLLCYKRIKQNANYFYRNDEELDAQSFVCCACFKKSKDGFITVNGRSVRKTLFEKKKNDEVNEEPWVKCDKCQSWQHQICALFNNKRDLDNNAEYICPLCRIEEIDHGIHVPLPETAIFGAKDSPITTLSDHIEKRLVKRLNEERNGNLDEVLVAESLYVREVLSMDKKLNVSKQFLDILPEQRIYPAELPYRSRVILLFQKIEGVDVCIFVMYVQEFGSKCGHPSQGCVYISYLDSVKYFRPQIKSPNGEALRTFVYHEILIGYLDFCKKQGFTTCYIWSCPPKGDDYILYCHPKTQKIPKNDQLRHWYLSMLGKAAEENIVVGLTNIYDYFFVTNGKRDSKVTASRLPYFDGDYWSCRAMDLARDIDKESRGDYEKKLKELVTKRGLKAMGHTNPSKGNAKDILVMQKLGQNILPSKEDFIVAHLQHPCMHCREVIVSGKRWFCTECKEFQECERCHTTDVHTSKSGEVHKLFQVRVDIPSNTKENDITLDNKLFEDRNDFLSFCQKNQLQFDTLRRAKYSSMMILDHLKNLTTHCLSGNQKSEHTSPKMLEYLKVIQHASQCHSARYNPCSYPHCLQVKKLFCHAKRCTIRVCRGCQQCEKVWQGIIAHSRNCEDLECCVPRCRCVKASQGLCIPCLCKFCREPRERRSTNSSLNLCQ